MRQIKTLNFQEELKRMSCRKNKFQFQQILGMNFPTLPSPLYMQFTDEYERYKQPNRQNVISEKRFLKITHLCLY